MRKILLVLTLPLLLMSGCDRSAPPGSRAPAASAPEAAGGPTMDTATGEAAAAMDGTAAPTMQEAAGATYSGIYTRPVTLAGGVFEGEPPAGDGASHPHVALIEDFAVSGDLDGDGADETLVLLAETSGGSGSFTYLAALARREGSVENIATVGLGDRVQIRGWSLEDGLVEIALLEAGPDDAACCPSRLVTRRWALGPDGLREAGADAEGTLDTRVLEGVQWRLAGFGTDEPVPAEPEVTLVIYGDKIGGSSGCNRYMGSLVAGDMPGELRFGPLAGTRMACPEAEMELEQRFLGAMASVSRFSFHLGRLALSSVAEDGTVTLLLFEATPLPGDN